MATDRVRLALVIAGFLSLLPGRLTAAQLVFLIGIAVLLALRAVRGRRAATLLFLLVGSVVMRLVITDHQGSDVLKVTVAAIDRMLAGGDPYGIGYQESTPPGAPFPYGPVALAWYLPVRGAPELMELGAAVIVSIVLALQGRLVGLAVYAASPVLLATAVDGSNDTSLGLMLLAAFMVARRWPVAGAGLLALAVGFKLSALAWVPAYLAWAGARAAGGFVAVSTIAWAPIIAQWGIASFLRSTAMANDLHRAVIWSLGQIIRDVTGVTVEALDQLRVVLGGIVAAASLMLRRSLDGVILGGALVYLVTLHAGNWSTFAYFAALAPLACWRLDDWLGMPAEALVSASRVEQVRRSLGSRLAVRRDAGAP